MSNWFKRKESTPKMRACLECRCYFEPRSYDKDFGDYCETHAKPMRELRDRKKVVLDYAEANWEKLESRAKTWRTKRNEILAKSPLQSYMQLQQQAMAPMPNHLTSLYGGRPRGLFL